MEEQEYLTVGQLAREVGTTVRTIQYYDQQGLLSPSAKGPGNQRLYSSDDVEELYRILTLKYLGLSLADIKERKDSVNDVVAFREVLLHTMESLEEDFQDLVKRLSVLRTLLDRTSEAGETDWTAFAHTIETGDESGEFFWHRIADVMPASNDEADEAADTHERGMAVAKWHELIADTITLMSDHADMGDPRVVELAQRYKRLEDAQSGSLDQMFILAENITPHHGAVGSFDVLRDSVVTYLEYIKQAHCGDADGEA